MADLGGGVYVSRVDSDEYEPDDEVGGFVHTLFEDGETAAGLWKIGSDASGGAQGHELPAERRSWCSRDRCGSRSRTGRRSI